MYVSIPKGEILMNPGPAAYKIPSFVDRFERLKIIKKTLHE
jgi:hypothetical protein